MKLQRTDDINLEASEIQTQSSTGIWKLVVLAMGFVMATLDTTVVNVAIADIQNSLEISFTGITWVVDGQILTFASFLLAGGSPANRYGAKNILHTWFMFLCTCITIMCCGTDCRCSYSSPSSSRCWSSFIYAKQVLLVYLHFLIQMRNKEPKCLVFKAAMVPYISRL
ncbi:hypothetical protein ACUIJ5_00020 [Bacillus toyonensis]